MSDTRHDHTDAPFDGWLTVSWLPIALSVVSIYLAKASNGLGLPFAPSCNGLASFVPSPVATQGHWRQTVLADQPATGGVRVSQSHRCPRRQVSQPAPGNQCEYVRSGAAGTQWGSRNALGNGTQLYTTVHTEASVSLWDAWRTSVVGDCVICMRVGTGVLLVRSDAATRVHTDMQGDALGLPTCA